MQRLLIGTGNKGKATELRELFVGLNFEVIDLTSFDSIAEPLETGATFVENAEIKASAYSQAANCFAIGDDSGLIVDALGGRPGVYSARFAGKNASDKENISKLINELRKLKAPDNSAKFVCAMSLARPDGTILFTTEASCTGSILDKPIGHNGFGYDPLFVPSGYDKTFGQLPDSTKRLLSHRAMAARKMAEFLSSQCGLVT